MTVIEQEGDILLRRELPDGAVIEFEERVSGFRAYWYTGPEMKARLRLPSVTTIIGKITSKGALLDWYETEAATATLTLARQGFLDHVSPELAIEAIREAKMGGRYTASRAADRGKRIHKVLEDYCLTGDVPNPMTFPEDERGYLRGLIRWILKADPEPVEVERLVCDVSRGYAGRLDLRAKVHGLRDDFIIDLKTNRRAQIYPEAMLQVAAYHQADVKCGAEPALGGLLVAVGPDGSFAEGYAPLEAWDAWDAGLAFHASMAAMGTPLEVR